MAIRNSFHEPYQQTKLLRITLTQGEHGTTTLQNFNKRNGLIQISFHPFIYNVFTKYCAYLLTFNHSICTVQLKRALTISLLILLYSGKHTCILFSLLHDNCISLLPYLFSTDLIICPCCRALFIFLNLYTSKKINVL